jgi:hypothetical protein
MAMNAPLERQAATVFSDWADRSSQYQAGLMVKWQGEITVFTTQMDVVKGFNDEFGK